MGRRRTEHLLVVIGLTVCVASPAVAHLTPWSSSSHGATSAVRARLLEARTIRADTASESLHAGERFDRLVASIECGLGVDAPVELAPFLDRIQSGRRTESARPGSRDSAVDLAIADSLMVLETIESAPARRNGSVIGRLRAAMTPAWWLAHAGILLCILGVVIGGIRNRRAADDRDAAMRLMRADTKLTAPTLNESILQLLLDRSSTPSPSAGSARVSQVSRTVPVMSRLPDDTAPGDVSHSYGGPGILCDLEPLDDDRA